MDPVGVLEQQSDASETLAAATPPVEEHHVAGSGFSNEFIDERTTTVLEPLENRCRTGQVCILVYHATASSPADETPTHTPNAARARLSRNPPKCRRTRHDSGPRER